MKLFKQNEHQYWNKLTIQFKIAVQEHIQFAEKAIEILNNTVTKIRNNELDKCDFEQLKQLFYECKNEHNGINRKYDEDFKYENSTEYHLLKEKLILFRTCVDEYEYLDDTLNLVSTLVIDGNMIEFNGDVSNTQIQQNTNKSIQKNNS